MEIGGQETSRNGEEAKSPVNLNPFENIVVVKRFLKVCDKKDLPTFRLVSTQWHDLSLKRFREEMQVKIDLPKENVRGRYSQMRKNRLAWGQSDSLQDEGEPFRSFRLYELSFGTSETDTEPYSHYYNISTDLFWGKFGEWMRKLELVCTRVICVNSFKKVIFEETPNLQELRLVELELEYQNGRPMQVKTETSVEPPKSQLNLTSFYAEGDLPITWDLIFTRFPNIREFGLNSLEKNNDYDYDEQQGLIPLVDTLKQDSFRNLTITDLLLSISSTYTDARDQAAERFLRLPRLKLASLCLLIKGKQDDKEVRHAVTALQVHGRTLKKLRLFRWRQRICGGRHPGVQQEGFDLPFQLNTFTCLTELELDGGFCRNFHFLENTRNLKVLKMGRVFERILEETDMARVRNVVMVHLREFFFKDVEMTAAAVEMFAKVIPNLERLFACFGKESLRMACKVWGNLRDLEIEAGYKFNENADEKNFYSFMDCIEYSRIGDEGITGQESGNEARHPNITDLKYLHQLKLTKVEAITDVSIWEGFLKVPRLHTLTVALPAEISDDAFQALVDRFPRGGVTRLQPARIPPENSGDGDGYDLGDGIDGELFFPYHQEFTTYRV